MGYLVFWLGVGALAHWLFERNGRKSKSLPKGKPKQARILAEALGLHCIRDGKEYLYRGMLQGQELELRPDCIYISPAQPFPCKPRIETRSVFDPPAVNGRETGDPEFDRYYEINSSAEVLCLLDQQTRQFFPQPSSPGPHSLKDKKAAPQTLSISPLGITLVTPQPLEENVRLLVSLGARLSEDNLADAALIALNEPLPAIRKASLRVLSREQLPGAQREEIKRCLEDPHPEVRILAAGLLGSESVPALKKMLAEALEDENPAKQMECVKIVECLGRLKTEDARAVLWEALDWNLNLLVAGSLVKALDEISNDEQAAGLMKLFRRMSLDQYLPDAESIDCAKQVIHALGRYGSGPCRDFIRKLLQENNHREARLIALRHFWRYGEKRDIELLCKLQDSTRDRDLISSVEAAIHAIQSRLGKIDSGWLSLPEKDTGGLSIAANPEGALSLQPQFTLNPAEEDTPGQNTV